MADDPRSDVLSVDAAVQAQVALRLVAGLVEHLAQAGVLDGQDAASIAESAAERAESGAHSQRQEIARALRRIIAP